MKSFDQLPDYKDLQCLWKQERIERPIPNLELTPDSGMERGAEVVGWWIVLAQRERLAAGLAALQPDRLYRARQRRTAPPAPGHPGP